MKKIFQWVVIATFLSLPIMAATLTMSYEQVNAKIYQQTTNNPCVISDSSDTGQKKGSCSMPAGWPTPVGGTNVGGTGSFDLNTGSIFTVGDIRAILGDYFVLGLDLNQSSTDQVLNILSVTGVNVPADIYQITGAQIGSIAPTFNGNGYADFLFRPSASTSFSIVGLPANQVVTFRFALSTASDGGEQLFLLQGTPTGNVIPEPSTFVLLGAGLIGLGLWRRR